jgi:hypothetical protein
MLVYILLLSVPIHGFIHHKIPFRNKPCLLYCSSNENIKDFSTKIIKTTERIIDEPEPETTVTEIVRTGKFVDQDGKSNVWSVDPIIKVDETNKSNIGILLNMMTGIGTLSILVYMLSQVFPDY